MNHVRTLCWLLSSVLVGCSATAGPRGSAGPGGPRTLGRGGERGQGISVVELVVRTGAAHASQYGEPVRHALNATEKAIARGLGQLPVTHEPALSRMTRELAAHAPDRFNIPAKLVDGLMAWAGLPDPPPRLIVVEIPHDGGDCAGRMGPSCREPIDTLLKQVRTSLPEGPHLVYGVGVAAVDGGATRMIVAILERALKLEPMPVAIGAGETVVVKGRLVGDRRAPSLELTGPRGNWSSVPALLGDDGTFSARVACGRGRGVYQLEVLAEGVHGPEVTANFPLHCGVEPAREITVTMERLGPDVTAQTVERANFEQLNEERRARGLPPLQWDEDAAAVARAHSEEMARDSYVGHVSPQTGDVSARFRKAGLVGAVIRENVARGYGPRGIHDSLMHSPGHRVNMVATDVTHVGIGVVIAPPETDVPGAPRPVYATQNFFKKPGAGAPPDAELAPTLKTRVDGERRRAGLPVLPWAPRLSEVAQREAEQRARGRAGAGDALQKRVFALGYEAVALHQANSVDFDVLAGLDVFAQPPGRAIGVGVARAKKRGTEPGEFWVVVLVAER